MTEDNKTGKAGWTDRELVIEAQTCERVQR